MKTNLKKLTLASVFAALIVVFTVVPNLGYISTGVIEITTLHIVTILGAVFLGWKYGAVLGGVWGVTCLVRAFTNPLWLPFTNPLISVLPRIFVGLVAGLVFAGLRKTKLNKALCAAISAAAATLTNTVLVLSALYIFGGMIQSYAQFFEMFKTIITTIISLNGGIELAAAILLVPAIYTPLSKYQTKLETH
ncbi:MAG: ECF transporter S component [Clostridia bacterium]|nr:ECF transporter S component [Clostridia bacterium]